MNWNPKHNRYGTYLPPTRVLIKVGLLTILQEPIKCFEKSFNLLQEISIRRKNRELRTNILNILFLTLFQLNYLSRKYNTVKLISMTNFAMIPDSRDICLVRYGTVMVPERLWEGAGRRQRFRCRAASCSRRRDSPHQSGPRCSGQTQRSAHESRFFQLSIKQVGRYLPVPTCRLCFGQNISQRFSCQEC